MEILCLGLSHHTASVELRERVHYSTDSLQPALARFGCGRYSSRPPELIELAILSTCNRLELYAVSHSKRFDALVGFVSETTGVPPSEFESHLYHYTQAKAIDHLFRVASGLDSMILGEPQILGQVTEAYEAALGKGAAGPVLSALFRSAIHTGKRARTETAISRNPASISSIAVKLAESAVGNLEPAHVAIVGAGEMAELAVEALRARRAHHLTVVNRTHDHAAQLAERWNAQVLTFERLIDALAEADIVISSTGAPHTVIKPDMVQAALGRRPDRPLVLIDIAVPRDIDPAVSQIPNVYCYDIDDLEARLNGSMAERKQEIPRVEAIVAEEAADFLAYLRNLEIIPVISDLHAKADAIRRAEVDKTLRRMKGLSEADRRRIEALSEALVNKLLHDPTRQLKAEAGNGHAAEYAAAVRHLFALNDSTYDNH